MLARVIFIALLSLQIVGSTSSDCHAIGFLEDDYDDAHMGPGGTYDKPDDLSIPQSDPNDWITNPLVQLRANASAGGSGVIIAPNWILTADHVIGSNGNGTAFVTVKTRDSLGAIVPIDFPVQVTDVYRASTNPLVSNLGVTGLGPNDLSLIRITNSTFASIAALRAATLAELSPAIGEEITMGGWGHGGKFEHPGSAYLLDGGGQDELRWGRNRIAAISNGRYTTTFDESAPDYVLYEAQPRGGDSGGGWFKEQNQSWELFAITQGFPPDPPYPLLTAAVAVDVTRDDVLDWIEKYSDAFPLTLPTATTSWTGVTSQPWSTATSWTFGVPTSAATAYVDNYPNVTSQAAAKNLVVPSGGINVGASGELVVADTIYLDGYGEIIQSAGTVSSRDEALGITAPAYYLQSGGVNAVEDSLDVGLHGGDASDLSLYRIAGQSTLTARTISIGGASDGFGKMDMRAATPTVPALQLVNSTTATMVGENGHGVFIQSGGTHETARLIIGYAHEGDGRYELKGGTLISGTGGVASLGEFGPWGPGPRTSEIGVDGDATFVQTGGEHRTDVLHIATASTYSMSGGVLAAKVVRGNVNLSAGATIEAAGLVDYSVANFANAASATLRILPDALVILAASQQDFGTVDANAGTLSPHKQGTTLNITGAGFRGGGLITDPIVMGENGFIDGTLYFNSGIEIAAGTSAAPAILRGGLHSRPFVAGQGISIPSGSHLAVFGFVGLRDSEVAVTGTLSIAPRINGVAGILTLQEEHPDGSTVQNVLTMQPGSELSMRYQDNAPLFRDRIFIGENSTAALSGDLDINHISGFVTPTPMSSFALIDGTESAGVTGAFDRILVNGALAGGTQFSDSLNYKYGWAVTYVEDSVYATAALFGDANLDNNVTIADYTTLLNNFDHDGNQIGKTWSDADFNGDGRVTYADFILLENNFGYGWSSGGGSIPEPFGASPVIAAAIIVCLQARHRQRSRE
jgi:hypothetical protein